MEILCAGNEIFVLTGDVNIHLDTDESNTHRLRDIFLMFNLKQYVNFPTHKLGHTLDIVLTKVGSPSIRDLYRNNVELSDHFLLEFIVEVAATKSEFKSITYTNTKSSANQTFCEEIKKCL